MNFPDDKKQIRLHQKKYLHILIIVTLGILIYSNTFSVPMMFDDINYIVNNPAIKDLTFFKDPFSVQNLTAIAQPFRYNFILRILGYFTFALNYKIHGLNVAGYHAVNLLIHLCNAILVYLLIVLTYKTPFFSSRISDKNNLHSSGESHIVAFFSALLFVSHPVQTQAVTYITQRFASLATLFYLLALVAYIQSRLSESRMKRYTLYAASVGSAIAAMMTKEISFTLPVVIFIYEFFFFDGLLRRRILLLTPIVLTMLIIPLEILNMRGSITDIEGMKKSMEILSVSYGMSRWDYLVTQIRVIVTYLRLLIFPVNQNLDYDYPVYHSLFDPQVFISFMLLLTIFLIAAYLFYRSKKASSKSRTAFRLISFGIFWFFITLSIESSIIPIADVIFEHRIYLPSVGFIIALVTAIFVIKTRLRTLVNSVSNVIIPLLVVSVLLLSVAAYARNGVWYDEVRMWSDVVKKSPWKARPHNNLGLAFDNLGLIDKAVSEYQKAVSLEPRFEEAYYNLGVVYYKQGRLDDAAREFQVAIGLNPDDADAHNNLGVIYSQLGYVNQAMQEFLIAIRLNPYHTNAIRNLEGNIE